MKTGEVIWLVKCMENDDLHFKNRFEKFLILESVPSRDAHHKIIHLVRNKFLEKSGSMEKWNPNQEDMIIRVVSRVAFNHLGTQQGYGSKITI